MHKTYVRLDLKLSRFKYLFLCLQKTFIDARYVSTIDAECFGKLK